MSFPLFTETYQINGRTYRNPAFKMEECTPIENQFEDTPDIYDNESSLSSSTKFDNPISESHSKGKNGKDNEEKTEDERISLINGKKWVAKILIPQMFMRAFIGFNQTKIKELENSTQCRVNIPKKGHFERCEIISYKSLESVQRCLDRIDIFICDSKAKAAVTHFVALPCNHQKVIECFENFQTEVLNNSSFDKSCQNSKLFIKSSKLHVTAVVGWIFDEEDLIKMKNAFEEIEKRIKVIMNDKPLIVNIHGIDIMNDDPSNVDVLFSKIHGNEIQCVVNLIRDQIVDRGIGKKENDEANVKLHMTLMNSKYASKATGGKPQKFDASQILQQMGDFNFGTITISEICLCPLRPTQRLNGFYEKMQVIKLK